MKVLLQKICRSVAIACALALPLCASSQETLYKFDVGAQLGASGYIGEANNANLMSHPGFVGEATFRYLPNTRWAVRALVSAVSLGGDTKNMDNVPLGKIPETFHSQLFGAECRGEFNFFPYGVGESYKKIRRWTPYLTLGVGFGVCSADGHTYATPVIPIGAGVKFKLRERINLGLEFVMTKTFTDHLDGEVLADMNDIKTAFYKNTDWYSRLMVGISFEFGKRCRTCHYVGKK